MTNIAIICKKKTDQQEIFALLSGRNDFQIIYTGRDGYDTLSMIVPYKPDIIIMDLELPDIEGTALASIIKRRSPSTAIMVFGSDDKGELAGRSIKAGISAYLLKGEDMDRLADLVRIVSSGGYYISPSIIVRVFGALQLDNHADPVEEAAVFQTFSPTERNILIFLAQGLSDQQIAAELNITQGAVRNCLTRTRRKTGMKNRTQIVIYALMYGLINFSQLNRQIASNPGTIGENGGNDENRMRNRSGNPELQVGCVRL